MDQRRKRPQPAGICQRLFYFFMKSLALQAAKPVILGPHVMNQQTRRPNGESFDQLSSFRMSQKGVTGSIKGNKDSESLASIEIEDETCALLGNKVGGCFGDERKNKGPRKMVSIKEEPEIIYPNKRRRKNERQNVVDVIPLRSILKVGSKLRDNSVQTTTLKPY